MISAFGVDHGEMLSKARNGAGVTRARRGDPATSMVERKGPGYFHPSNEQVAASKTRRAQQAVDSQRHRTEVIPNRRVGAGRKLGWRVHRLASGRTAEVMAGTALIGGAATYALHDRTRVSKSEKDKNVALGSVAGGAGAATAFGVGGQATKIALKERRAKRGESPNEQKTWREHMAKYPKQSHDNLVSIKGGKVKVRPNNWKPFAAYPKSLPDWKAHRALAFKNRPGVGTAVVGAGALAGGLYGAHRNKKASA
jgi:hypothetical protein